ncbi:TetR/AcrR family transcriptional regulator [Nonomuraea jiangxiensis]|uniref:Regulatory protein, tetR family n=1 Tax=Nonomuraea jiangxiensis TaxID=633440 RepID=A0A1G9B5M2_9ACTN|nr:TetR/AcrR family transcriptional regulator [Nonomuraea jiangxiensis]SDK34165.1 regulatory protein, tetR family [Nonomuraea jiangxiensis]
MPKQVDHEQRRNQISEALWRIAAERGLEAVSMREVAAAAGVSIGLVQHYFASKDELVVHATSHLRRRLDERIRRGVAAVPEPVTPPAALRALLTALLPADPESRAETLVGIAVFIRALNDPALADRYRQGRAQLTAAVADLLGRAAPAAGESSGEEAELAADTLLALVDGLASDLLLGHLSPERAQRILDRQLTNALGR